MAQPSICNSYPNAHTTRVTIDFVNLDDIYWPRILKAFYGNLKLFLMNIVLEVNPGSDI